MFAMHSIIRVLALAGALVFLVMGCSRTPQAQLPSGDNLLRAAAQEMRSIGSVRFDLEVDGPLGDPTIQRATGVLTQQGNASVIATLDIGGTAVEYEVVVFNDQLYLKGPTGRFQAVPPALLSGGGYNPTMLLNPSEGVAQILSNTGDARTEAVEAVNGTQAYRVRATIDAEALKGLLPVPLKEDKVPAVLWIGQEQPVLLKAQLTATPQGTDEPVTMRVTLGDFNEPVEISPPAT
jgi:lipoprotein LprG